MVERLIRNIWVIFFNLDKQFRRSCRKFILLSALVAIFFGVFANFIRAPHKDHLGEIIFNMGQQFQRRCHLKIILYFAMAAISFGEAKSVGRFG